MTCLWGTPCNAPWADAMPLCVCVKCIFVCRQGIARAMLVACDEAVLQNGQDSIWLHVRQADEAAQQLYAGYAYREKDRDRKQAGLFGFGSKGSSQARPRILLWRSLKSSAE